MSDWFFMLGEPLAGSEREQVRGYLDGLRLSGQTAIESVPGFAEAARIISHPDWDRRWWDAEQRERERLRAKVAQGRDPGQLLQALSQSAEQAIAAPHGAAAVQAARMGCSDPGLIRAAAGALAEALYLAKLAELAAEASSHPFLLKLALFAGGHWPLALVDDHLRVLTQIDRGVTMNYVFPVPAVPSVAVAGAGAGSELGFPVHRIYCVGRNYAEHAREMGFEPEREPPFFFTKPADAIVADGATIGYALGTQNLHHEIELVVAIGKSGVNVTRDAALDHVYGYAVGIDMTRRDLQLAARDKGRPWDVGKAFDESAPISKIHRASEIGHPAAGAIRLSVNGKSRQDADLKQLLWAVPDLIVELSRLFVLRPGDLIYTGTPAGVGAVTVGDELHGSIEGVDTITIRIGAPGDRL